MAESLSINNSAAWTLTEWTLYLGELLKDASAASGSGDAKAIQRVQRRLEEFENRSPGWAHALDRIALVTIIGLDLANTKARLQVLEEQTQRYKDIRRLLDGIESKENNDNDGGNTGGV